MFSSEDRPLGTGLRATIPTAAPMTARIPRRCRLRRSSAGSRPAELRASFAETEGMLIFIGLRLSSLTLCGSASFMSSARRGSGISSPDPSRSTRAFPTRGGAECRLCTLLFSFCGADGGCRYLRCSL
eukprot:scaffold177066_cov32-Tisochrysis_lutea.AAC.1